MLGYCKSAVSRKIKRQLAQFKFTDFQEQACGPFFSSIGLIIPGKIKFLSLSTKINEFKDLEDCLNPSRLKYS